MTMHLEDGKEFYTIDEAAHLFGVQRQTIYDWMVRRSLRWVVIGGRRKFTRDALERFVKPGDMPEQRQSHGAAEVIPMAR
jgi:excisionase family DNA binding protein